MQTRLSLVLGLALAGCTGGRIDSEEPQAEDTADIIGGALDNGDPSVILVFAQEPGSQYGSLCTASVIAPTVLLTAAHCVDPSEVGSNVTFAAFTGSDLDANNGSWLPVAKVDWDHQFDAANLSAGHDVGIVVLQNPVSLKPLPYNKSAAITSMAGQAVRIVGYGNNDGVAASGAGKKRQATTTLNSVSAKLLHIGDDARETCQGDSGGPAFMNLGGVETLVGVTSYGRKGCTGGGYDTRVDLYSSFIDGYVGGSAPPPPPPTCGAESEPNDANAAANPLCADGKITGAIGSASDVDWFTYLVAAGQNYYVTLSALPADYNFTVYKLVNGALSTIGTAPDNHDRADQQLARNTPSGGTYYVKVFGVNGATSASRYSLTVHN